MSPMYIPTVPRVKSAKTKQYGKGQSDWNATKDPSKHSSVQSTIAYLLIPQVHVF